MDVRISNNNCKELIYALDLESALITSEATILAALERNESRGAHQRSDFQNLSKDKGFNIYIKLKNNSLKVFQKPLKTLRDEFKIILSNSNRIKSFKNKLLE